MTGGSKMSHLGHLGSILECMIGTDLVVPRLIKHDMIRTRLCQKLQDESTLRHTHTQAHAHNHTQHRVVLHHAHLWVRQGNKSDQELRTYRKSWTTHLASNISD